MNTPLDPTYDRVIESINQKSESRKNLAIMIFTWLVTAKRPLKLSELQLAVSIKEGQYELDELELPDRNMILEVCASLVTIDEASDIVRLAHFTVQEYLQRYSIIHEDAEFKITAACLTYLSFSIFGKDFCTCGPTVGLYSHRNCSFWETYHRPPLSQSLLKYAALYLSSHLENCEEEKSLEALLRFLEHSDNICSYIRVLYRGSSSIERLAERPIHVASALGHLLAAQKLLEGGANISALDGLGKTALFLAASLGHEKMIFFLLEKGADISTVDNSGQTVLFGAASGGNEGVLRVLLEKGADISTVDNSGRTALFEAASGGNEGVLRVLLEKGADISTVDNSGRTALFEAASDGNEAVLRVLLEKGADISTVDNSGRTALFEAASDGNGAVLRVLLEKGADISTVDNSGQTALFEATIYGREAVVKALLEKGADISIVDEEGKTALLLAVERGNKNCAKLLREKGLETKVV